MLHDSVSLMCHVSNHCSPQVSAWVEGGFFVSTLPKPQTAMNCMEKTIARSFGLELQTSTYSDFRLVQMTSYLQMSS